MELVVEAHGRGYEALHVNYLGMLGKSDRGLLPHIVAGDFTFVTNNRKDFLGLYRSVDVHAGLLIILPSINAVGQLNLFIKAVDAIEARGIDITNELVEVDISGNVSFSPYPRDGGFE